MQCRTCQTPLEDTQRFCPNCGTLNEPSEPPAADPMIGLVLGGKYKVNRLLGQGGMGAVYEGEQQLGTTKRKVAIKTLHPHLSRDAKVKARFEREVGTIAELEHPNTIQVYDFGTTPDDILYIVMEFLQGKSLADLLEKESAMTPERVANILGQVCGSLEEAHGRGIVHRDLKPDNVVLVERAGKKDFVKVLDFGIAKRSREEDKDEQKLTQQGMVLGTPPYMSPEQFTGRPIDARSDIYSLAVMAYQMLCGRLPFQADTAWEWATQHMTAPPLPMEATAEGMRAPAPMRAAVQRALSKSPQERFQTVKEFNDAFSAGLAGPGAQAPMASFAGVPGGPSMNMGPPPMGPQAYGPPPAGPPPYFVPTPGPQAYGLAPGDVSYPGPVGALQPPPPRRGRGRLIAFIVGGVVVLGGAVAVVLVIVLQPDPPPPRPPVPVVTAPPPKPPTPTPPHPNPAYNGVECQKAREFHAAGKVAEAKEWAALCIAKGGAP
jgi:eukaryotic-like serine/threonine-protein kinase